MRLMIFGAGFSGLAIARSLWQAIVILPAAPPAAPNGLRPCRLPA
jgi:hypothetical protein